MLRAELAAAQHQRDDAATCFTEIMCDVPSGIPSPDGPERIRQVSREYGETQAKATAALVSLNDFLVYGKTPPHLEKKPGTQK
jgi:hypothetical protein